MTTVGSGGAAASIGIVRNALNRVGWSFLDLQPAPEGAGVIVGWDQQFVVLSVLEGMPSKLWVTAGIRRDIDQDDRQLVLEYCNACTRSEPTLPVYLHDEAPGWDLLIGSAYPLQPLCESSAEYFMSLISNFPVYQAKILEQLNAIPMIGGEPYRWSEADRSRLFRRAVT